MDKLYERITWVFDAFHKFYESEKVHSRISGLLVIFFVLSLFVIELNRWGLLPEPWGTVVPSNYFYAIIWAFTVILVLEIISLIFVIPCSFSRSVGKQFLILALILMRNAFKELSYFDEPVTFYGNEEAILRIVCDGFGAVIIFALLGVFYLVQNRYGDAGDRKVDNLYQFVAAKKGVALCLLFSFIVMGGLTGYKFATGYPYIYFFNDFYTLLIITDILLVLVAQRYNHSPYAMFRNSGFALCTMIIRLALVAPAYYNVLMGVSAVLLAIGLTLVSQILFPPGRASLRSKC
jgi:hypothetical protein